MIPRLYAPMLNQPTSSPMMTTMLGFLSCAHAACAKDRPMIAPIINAIAIPFLLQLSTVVLLPVLTFRPSVSVNGWVARGPDANDRDRRQYSPRAGTCLARRFSMIARLLDIVPWYNSRPLTERCRILP